MSPHQLNQQIYQALGISTANVTKVHLVLTAHGWPEVIVESPLKADEVGKLATLAQRYHLKPCPPDVAPTLEPPTP